MAPIKNGADVIIGRTARFWLPAAAVACWELAARTAEVVFFPPPTLILVRMYELWFRGSVSEGFLTPEAREDLLPSLARLGAGWAVAAVAGLTLGVLVGRVQVMAALLEPVLHFARSTPPSALLPVFMVFFGIGTPLQVASIAFGVIWPVLINTIDGVRYIDAGYLDTAAVLRLGLVSRLIHVVLPAAVPKIFAGLRLSISLALIMMIVSEMFGSIDGLGYRLREAEGDLDVAAMWAIVVLLGTLGVLLNSAFLALERRRLAWRAS
ncbi:ABC transporter permease subunit [Nonomuraea sp. NPDC046802]|uniref:ABC transporter permease n=1 Tax=Nonomuraea sp. NPDC046802 TaxID=3154919 RepID=UPI0034063222